MRFVAATMFSDWKASINVLISCRFYWVLGRDKLLQKPRTMRFRPLQLDLVEV